MTEYIQRFDPRKHMNRNDYEIFHYRGTVPEEKEVHHHDFYELFFLLGGRVTYWAEGKTYHLKPGDILLINPMVLHRPVPEEVSAVYDRIVLWINKDYIEELSDEGARLDSCFKNPMSSNTGLLHFSSGQRVFMTNRLDELVRESYSEEFGSNIYAEGLLRQFMVELNRFFKTTVFEREEQRESSPLVDNVLNFIGENYSKELSLEEIANRFYVSKYHLSHEFSREMGTSVYKYITLKRLLSARQMLLEGIPAGEASVRCGFKDYTNFYRAFKAEYGISPAELK